MKLKVKNQFEKISFMGHDYLLKWVEGDVLPPAGITQVSGYIINNAGKLLIVKDNKHWTIPGGKPKEGESTLGTLERETFEEAYVTVSNPFLIGHVIVVDVERNTTNYQLRYFAKIDKEMPFEGVNETIERKFISFNEIKKYITWYNDKSFQAQLNTLNKFTKHT